MWYLKGIIIWTSWEVLHVLNDNDEYVEMYAHNETYVHWSSSNEFVIDSYSTSSDVSKITCSNDQTYYTVKFPHVYKTNI